MIFNPYNTKSDHCIRMQHRDENVLRILSQAEFQEKTGVQYVSHLLFESEQEHHIVLNNCPWILRFTPIGKENRDLGRHYHQNISIGYIAAVSIQWIDETFAYGLFADSDLKKGEYIGEYTGIVRRLSRCHPDPNAYCVHYPTQLGSMKYFVIDACEVGNEMRYVNHSNYPNVEVKCLLEDGLLHFVFFAKEDIGQGEQIVCDYGQDYWQHRKKSRLS